MSDSTEKREPILIAEDDRTSRMIMESVVASLGYEPFSVSDGLEAWEFLSRSDAPALALIDWEMPHMDGLDLIKKIRMELSDRFMYLIMVTAKSAREEIVEGIGWGADDYIVKPFDPKELGVRIRAGHRIVDLQRRLQEANRQLEELAKTDGLTGFYNRLALQRDLMPRVRRDTGNSRHVSFIVADIDYFKKINDEWGHDAGDSVLRQFSERIRDLLRQGDVVCRMGGEEFLLVAPTADSGQGKLVAERIRRTIEESPFALPSGGAVSVTCSLGVCSAIVENENLDFDSYVKKADIALYQSKRDGRNRVTVFLESEAG